MTEGLSVLTLFKQLIMTDYALKTAQHSCSINAKLCQQRNPYPIEIQ